MGRTRDLMATAAVRGVLAAIRRSDADLLRRFAAGRDDAAFAELVRRHGPLVLGVCRRVVADRHLADDAFQAAFVVLANKAGGLDADRPLGPWLYGVAFRVALRARLMIGRRRKRETLTATVPDVPTSSGGTGREFDLSAVVDEEISRLSAVGREAVVLCEMQGLSRKEAAARLGVAEGTLSSRLAAARKALAGRLRKRGVTLAGGLFGATALVPPELLASTVAMSTGKAELSSHLTALIHGATHMALLSKLKLTALATAVVLLSAGGVGVWPGGESSAAPVPKAAKDDEVLLVSSMNDRTPFLIVSPDGRSKDALPVPAGIAPRSVRVSPDGRWVVYADQSAGGGAEAQGYHPCRVRLIDLHAADTEPRTLLDETYAESLSWSADGKAVFVSRFDPEQIAAIRGMKNGLIPMATTRITLAGGKETQVKLPDGHRALAVSPDEATWLTHTIDTTATTNEAFVVSMTGGKAGKTTATGKSQLATQFSADGKRALCGTGSAVPGQPQLAAVDLATMKLAEITPPDGVNKNWIGFARWSADGRRLAFAWSEQTRGRNGEPKEAYKVTVCDADGTNPVTVAELEPGAVLRGIDWLPAKKGAPAVPRRRNAPVPKAEKDDGLIWTHTVNTNTLSAFTPDGKEAKKIVLPDGLRFVGFTPDGARMMFVGKNGKLPAKGDVTDGWTLHVGPIGDQGEGTDTGLNWQVNDQFVWSPDGKQVVRQRLDKNGIVAGAGGGAVGPDFSHVLFDVVTKKETPIGLPTDHQIMQWAADGKTWRVLHNNLGKDPALPNYRWLTAAAGDKPKLTPVCDTHSFLWLDPAPDGKGDLGVGWKHVRPGGAAGCELLRVADGKAESVMTVEGVAFMVARRSPDGKRAACIKYEFDAKNQKLADTVLTVLDADGKNETKLFTSENDGQNTRLLGWFPTKPADARKRNAPPPKAAPPEGVILVAKMSHKEPDKLIEVLGADGTSRGHLPVGELTNVQQVRVSPDGTKMAYVRFIPRSSRDKWGLYAYPQDVYVADLPLTALPKEPALKALVEPTIAWAADGKSLFVSSIPPDTNLDQDGIKGQMIPKKTVRYDVAAKTEKAVDLPQWHAVLDATPDGKALLTRTHKWGGGFTSSQYTNYLVPLDTLKPKVVGVENDGFAEARLSPDGTRVVGTRGDFYKTKEAGVYLADVKSNTVERVPVADEIAAAVPNGGSVVWAPDGKRLAVLWQGAASGRGAGAPGGGGPGRGGNVKQITVLDVDGKNAKTVREFAADDTVLRIEWADPKLADVGKSAQPKK